MSRLIVSEQHRDQREGNDEVVRAVDDKWCIDRVVESCCDSKTYSHGECPCDCCWDHMEDSENE